MRQKPKVLLRRLKPEDQPLTLKWRNDPSIYRWCRQADVLHQDSHHAWFDAQARDSTMSMYLVETIEGERLGVCGLTSIDLINRRAEFSLYIGPEHQEQGYGEAALRALIKKGFDAYGLNSIWGEAFDGNPTMKMFTRVGFVVDGRRRQFYFREGKYVDAILFSILHSDYAASNNQNNKPISQAVRRCP